MHALNRLPEAESLNLLGGWMLRRRWFRSKAKTLTSVAVEAHAPVGRDGEREEDGPRFCILKTGFSDGTFERYALPLVLRNRLDTTGLPEDCIVGSIPGSAGGPDEKILCDAGWDAEFRGALFELLTGVQKVYWAGEKGVLQGRAIGGPFSPGASEILNAEQSNTSFVYSPGGSEPGHFVKLYRRLDEAVNPEPEILRFLRERTTYRHVPRFEASLEWTREGHIPVTVALMQERVEARGDAWEYTLENLRASAASGAPDAAFTAWVSLLGRRVAELHAALGSAPDLPDFAPEPLTLADLDHLRTGTRALLHGALVALEAKQDRVNASLAGLIEKLAEDRPRLEALLQDSPDLPAALKIRTHGDLHLGQILVGARSHNDVWILDFEGEPGRPMSEARRKQSPLRDVAGMLRSFHYAAHTVKGGEDRAPAADALAQALCAAFLEGYLGEERNTSPAFSAGQWRLLDLFVLEKAVYELHYELNNRPDWIEIPVRGLIGLLEGGSVEKPGS
jgi:trehalose synthase-fused probable maltokinase